jgi:3-oxoacyl-[acyl-carrier protein] reductase
MTGKVALVTGASRGIGLAIAAIIRDRGVKVIAPSRGELDLADRKSIDAYLKRLDLPVDILINNAGINELAGIEEIDREVWDKMIQVDLTAPLELCKHVAQGMKQRGWGRILNISSVFSLVTKERRAAYSAVKSGLNGLTRTMALELAPNGILVNALCPGYVATELTKSNNTPDDLIQISKTIPLGRLAEPDELAKVALFLCSEENTYLTGQTIVVDGGFVLR